METYNFVSFVGIFILLGFAWLCSAHKKLLNWRVILWGTGLRLLVVFFIFINGPKTCLFSDPALSWQPHSPA
jgi:nucleoside permease NupC